MVNTKIRLITFFAVENGKALHNQKKRGEKLKKRGKTTRQFSYDLN